MTQNLKQENNTSKPTARKALGRGLAALLPEADYAEQASGYSTEISRTDTTSLATPFFLCPIDKLVPCSRQPRQVFRDEEIKGLSESIKENGIIQPLIVRNSYEIVAGERRWRAAKLAGLKSVPVIFRDMSDKTTLQTALVENIQRADLNSIEEAKAYKQLIEEFSMTHDDISKTVGKERSSITNYLRLLKLPEELMKITNEVARKGLSVRETENLVNRVKKARKSNNIKLVGSRETMFDAIEDNLREKFKTKVRIDGKYEKGKFVIEYFNKDDFERILSILFE
jgi:ParB family chromosome partitioning protein